MGNEGRTFVDIDAIAQALGGTSAKRTPHQIQVAATGMLVSDRVEDDNARNVLTDAFRGAGLPISHEIEHLRSEINLLSSQRGRTTLPLAIWGESDIISAKIATLREKASSNADLTIYYAMSHANLALVTSQSRLLRSDLGNPSPTSDDLDSLACSTEARIALVKGKLTGMEQCSVMVRGRESGAPHREEAPLSFSCEQRAIALAR